MSKLIRDYMDTSPDAKPAEICEYLLSQHGVEVSGQYVSTIKSQAKSRLAAQMSDDPGVARLQAAKEFCARMGGIDKAIAAVRDLAGLLD